MDFLCAFPPSANSVSFTSYTPAPPVAAASSSSSSSSSSSFIVDDATTSNSMSAETRAGRGSGGGGSALSEVAGSFVSGLLTCVFAIVGLFVGAATGAVIGLATESGLFRGAGVGAISGVVFSIDAAESSLVIWRSRGSGFWSVLYVMDIVASLLSGRLVREKVGPAVQNAVQSQISALDSPFREVPDIFETGGTTGMPSAAVEKIPKTRVTAENCLDASGDNICCSVCLQDLQPGETARRLPHCRHMFHLPCIDGWLVRHGSCPLCRRDF